MHIISLMLYVVVCVQICQYLSIPALLHLSSISHRFRLLIRSPSHTKRSHHAMTASSTCSDSNITPSSWLTKPTLQREVSIRSYPHFDALARIQITLQRVELYVNNDFDLWRCLSHCVHLTELHLMVHHGGSSQSKLTHNMPYITTVLNRLTRLQIPYRAVCEVASDAAGLQSLQQNQLIYFHITKIDSLHHPLAHSMVWISSMSKITHLEIVRKNCLDDGLLMELLSGEYRATLRELVISNQPRLTNTAIVHSLPQMHMLQILKVLDCSHLTLSDLLIAQHQLPFGQSFCVFYKRVDFGTVFEVGRQEQMEVCPLCEENGANRYFLPCTHLCCSDCIGVSAKVCPFCMHKIIEVVSVPD